MFPPLDSGAINDPEELAIFVRAEKLAGQIPIDVRVTSLTELVKYRLAMAAIVMAGLYVLIITEICHRSLAAMLGKLTEIIISNLMIMFRSNCDHSFLSAQSPGSTAAITCLLLIGDQPSMTKVISWIDWGTLLLLLSE